MNKKYLSVILFGALMLGTTGTFTSCKDYDDDINNLQTQINSNKDAIAALQKLVGEGKWVTSVTPIENGFTVTMSDGTSQTVTGINGKDGKPGTVITLDPTTNNWIIDGVDTGICAKGEKGDKGDTGAAGEQGPAGTPGQQGPAGANGKNAPSPQIDPETGNWIVYAWDETTGDYKATVTDVYAHAANVYVVKKEGYIELNVDDVAYQLPTTSDAYTVQAPFTTVTITTETGKWNPTTTSKDYQTLLKAFPEIGEIEKGALLKQGAELPVLVSPASIDLTEGFTFSLQSLKDGMVEDITLSNPAKGISSEWEIRDGAMTRAANTEDCLWTLQIEQELKDGKYAHADNVALVVENANGKVVKTPFVYTISKATNVEDVSVEKGKDNPEFAAEIDLLAPVIKADGTEGEAPIQITNEYEGKYIITLANQLQVEKYGLSIVDGHKLAIATPGNETNIPVTLNVVALGLNGSTYNTAKDHDITINVTQTIASTGQLSEKNITLSTKAISSTNLTIGQIVKWNIEELGFTTATQLDAFIKATKNITLVGEDKNGDEVTTSPYTVNVVDANGVDVGTNGYAKAKAFQIELPSKDLLPIEYKLVLEAKDGSSVIYKTETTLTVSNPKVEDLFALATAYTTDGKVLQVVGKVASNQVTYTIADGVVLKVNGANAQIVKYEDLDHANWEESDGSQTWGSVNWVTSNEINIPIEGEPNDEGKNHMNKERNIRGTFSLFGNSDNTIEYDFRIKVISAVYTADASNVKIDATKMAGNFGGSVDLTKGISATYAAGINVGKALALFDIPGTASTTETVYYNAYTAEGYETSGDYVLDTDGKPIEIAKEDWMDFGMSAAKYIELEHCYLKVVDDETTGVKGWKTIMTALLQKYEDNNEGGLKLKDEFKEDKGAQKEVAIEKALFDKYYSQINWNGEKHEKEIEKKGTDPQSKAKELASVVFTLADNDASKYCKLKDNAIKANENISDSDLVDGKAVVNVKVAIKDIWGLTMTKTFQVTLTKK